MEDKQQQKLHDDQDVRLFIAVPSGGTWHANMAMSMAFMCSQLTFPMEGIRHTWHLENVKATNIASGRERLAQKALDMDSTHILFIDSDQTFPPETAHRLLQNNLPIVAANCTTRFWPPVPTARLRSDKPEGELLYVYPKSDGIRKVWRVGAGIMLIRCDILKHIPKPWFPITWSDERQDYDGEDWNFVVKAELHGYDTYVDMGLSRYIGHIGNYEFHHRDVAPPEKKLEVVR